MCTHSDANSRLHTGGELLRRRQADPQPRLPNLSFAADTTTSSAPAPNITFKATIAAAIAATVAAAACAKSSAARPKPSTATPRKPTTLPARGSRSRRLRPAASPAATTTAAAAVATQAAATAAKGTARAAAATAATKPSRRRGRPELNCSRSHLWPWVHRARRRRMALPRKALCSAGAGLLWRRSCRS